MTSDTHTMLYAIGIVYILSLSAYMNSLFMQQTFYQTPIEGGLQDIMWQTNLARIILYVVGGLLDCIFDMQAF